MFHCGESSRKPHGPENLRSLQRNISVLYASQISNHNGAPLQALVAELPGGPMINLASANDHVSEIELKIRVVNERCRAAQHGLPFQRILNLLTIHIVF